MPFDNDGTVESSAGVLSFVDAFPAYNSASKTLTKGTYIANSPGKIQIFGLDIGTLSAKVTLNGASAELNDGNGVNGLRNLTTISGSGDLTVKNGKVLTSAKPVSSVGHVTIGGGANSTENSRFAPSGTFTQTGGQTTLVRATSKLASGKVIINGGVLKGIGIVQASGNPGLSIGGTGTLAPGLSPGTLTVAGSYEQKSTGTLAIEVNGTAVGQADKLAISGTATLGGTLAITTGYVEALGDQIQILTAGLDHGQVREPSSGANLSGLLSYQVAFTASDVTLKVVRPAISVSDVSITEGNAGTRNLTFTVDLSDATAATIKVPWQTAVGATNPATAGSDYTADSGTVTWNYLDALTKTVTVVIAGDTIYELDETLALNLGTPTKATLTDATAVGTISNDDAMPVASVSAAAPSVVEGDNPDTTPAAFTVSLDREEPAADHRRLHHRGDHRNRGHGLHGPVGDAQLRRIRPDASPSTSRSRATPPSSPTKRSVSSLSGPDRPVTLGTGAVETIIDDDAVISASATWRRWSATAARGS